MGEPLTPMELDTPSPASDQVKRTLGVLSGQLKGSSALTLPPTSAVEMKSTVEQKYTSKPEPVSQPMTTIGMTREERAADATEKFQTFGMDLFSESLLTGMTLWDLMNQRGQLSPETQQAIKEKETRDAKRKVAEREAAAIAAAARALENPELYQDNAPGTLVAPPALQESEYWRKLIERSQPQLTERYTNDLDQLYKEADGEQELKTLTWWYDAGNRTMKSALDMGISVPEWMAQWVETMEAWRTGSEVEKSKYRENVEAARKLVDAVLPSDRERDDEFLAQLSQGTGSMIGFMVMGYVARTMGGGSAVAQNVGIGISGAAVQGSQSFRDAERYDADTIQKTYALFAGSSLGLTELIPISRMLTRAEMATGGAVSRAIRNTAAGSIEEFLQEFGQGVLADTIASTPELGWDEGRKYEWGEYFTQGLIGAITGGAVGGITSLAGGPGPSGEEDTSVSPEEQAGLDIIADEQRRIDEIDNPEVRPGEAVDPATAVPEPAVPAAEPVNLPDPAMELPPEAPDVGAVAMEEAAALVNEMAQLRVFEGPPTAQMEMIRKNAEQAIIQSQNLYRSYLELQGPPDVQPIIDAAIETINAAEILPVPADPAQVEPVVRAVLDALPTALEAAPVGAVEEGTGPLAPTAVEEVSRQVLAALPENLQAMPVEDVTTAVLAALPSALPAAPVGAVEQGDALPDAEPVNLPDAMAMQLPPNAPDLDEVLAMAVNAQIEDQARYDALRSAPSVDAEQYTPPKPTAEDYTTRAMAPMVDAAGGKIRVNADGLVELSHWSPVADLDVLDPAMQGTGPLRGMERRRLFPGDPYYTQRTYYGVNAVEGMPAKEARQIDDQTKRVGGYRREGGLGGNRYTVLVDPNRLYNWYQDPDGIRTKLDRTAPNSEQVTAYEFLIREAGWDGIFFEQGGTGQVVMMFTPEVPIEAMAKETLDFIAQPERTAKLMEQVPGLKGIFKYVTDEEQQRIRTKRGGMALLEKFQQMPPAEEMAAAAIAGRAKKGWYADSANALIDVFGMEDAPRFAALLAALSPQVSVETNLSNALRVWTAWVQAGRPTDPKRIQTIMGVNVQGDKGENSILGAWLYNSFRALTAPDPTQITLSGPKVNSFMLNLRNVTNEVTNDAWMANFALINQEVFKGRALKEDVDGTGKVAKKSPGYIAMNAAVRRAAEIATELTGEEWTPANVQETVWSWAKAIVEMAQANALSPTEIVRQGLVTDDLIASVPDFAVLFNNSAYRAILERGGYDVSGALDGRPAGSDEAGGDAGGGEGAATAQLPDDVYGRHLGTAARRLDRLVAARRKQEVEEGLTVSGETDAVPAASFGFATEEDLDVDLMGVPAAPVRPSDFNALTPEALTRPGYAVLTANLEEYGPPDSPENQRRNAELLAELQSMGAQPIEAEGVYKGTPDGNVYIAFMSEDEAQALGRKYQQESVLTNRGLIFMDGTFVGANHAESVVGPEAEQQDFYTVMPDGTMWSMGLDQEDMGGDTQVRDDVVSGTEMKGDGRKFTNFFADVTRGVRQQPKNLEGYQPAIPPTETMKQFAAIREPFSGNFENHIQTSIPGYREAQDAVGVALVNAFGTDGADVLDIGGSEGAMLKAAADVTRGKVHGTILDPNPAMKQTFDEKPSVRGVTYAMEAFSPAAEAGQLAWTEDDGTEIYNFTPKRKYDVAYEAMVFQFISNSRNAQIARVKELLKKDGLFVTQEKLGGPAEYYNANEAKKDEYKALYYDEATLEAKRQEVLQTGGDAVEGMTDLQVTDAEFRRALANNFKYVVQFWDSGNFKGYVASDSEAKVQAFVDALPSDLQSDYSTRPTPAMVARGNADIDFTGLSSSNREAYVGEPKRPGFVPDTEANAPAPADSDLTLAKIANNLVEAVGATVRQGRLARKQGMKVMGQFQRKTGVTRLRFKDDVITMAHELGHHLHEFMGDAMAGFVGKHSLELRKAGKKMYPGDLSNETKQVQEREGFAEFFRVFVTNRDYARRHFPKLTGDFETFLSEHDPQMKEKLGAIGMQLRAWINLPSQSKLRNQIITNRRPEGIDAAIKELAEAGIPAVFDEWARRSLQAGVNRYASLNALVDQMLTAYEENKGKAFELKLADDPRVLARLARNSTARAMVQIKNGVMGYRSTEPRTKGIRDILLTIHGKTGTQELANVDQKTVDDFNTYIVALRALDEWRREAAGLIERAPVFTKAPELREVAKELEAKYGKKFTQAAGMVNDYNKAEWEKAYDAGLISREVYEQGNTRQFYAPLQRDMSDRGLTQYGQMTVTAPRSFVKRFRGSDRDIIAPLDVMMQKTMSMEATIAHNEVGKALAQLADNLGQVGFGVERIPAYQLQPVQIEVAQAMRQLTQLDSLTDEDANELATMLQAAAEKGDRLTAFKQNPAMLAGINALQFWENGKLSAVQLADGQIGADIVDVIEGLGRENLNFGLGFAAHGATLVRTTVTKWPDFILVNFVRDQFSAFMLNRGYVPFLTGLKGLASELTQSSWARKYNASMGLMGGMNAATIDQARIGKDIQAALPKSYLRSAFSGHGMQRAANGFSRITEMTETGTRLGLFQSAYKRAKADGLTDWEAAVEASYRATDLIDFGLNGSRMLHARRLIPFFNAQIQGLYKMVRTLGGDEVARRKGYKFALTAYFKDINQLELSRAEKEALKTGRALWLKMGIISLFSAALHFLQEDDPDYQHASEFMRNSNWVITPAVHGGDPGRMITIPKPFELAILANATERALEHFGGDMKAKDRFMRGVMLSFAPPDGTPFYTLYNELNANHDNFSKREIVPFYMQRRPAQQQYNEYTTDFAKWLGEEMGWSPLKIDLVLSSLGTSAYRDLTSLGGQMDPSNPDLTKADWMILRRFWRKSASGATASRDFWELASSRRGEFEQAAEGYKNYKENGNPIRAESFLQEQDDNAQAYAIMKTEFEAEVERLHPMRRAVDVSGVMSAMKREIRSDLGLYSSAEWRKFDDNPAIPLSPRQKTELTELLTDISLRTTRNALIATDTPGWADKKRLDVGYTLDMIKAISPETHEELLRRIDKKKVYSESAVEAYWPAVKERAIEGREGAFFDDLIAISKARGAFE